MSDVTGSVSRESIYRRCVFAALGGIGVLPRQGEVLDFLHDELHGFGYITGQSGSRLIAVRLEVNEAEGADPRSDNIAIMERGDGMHRRASEVDIKLFQYSFDAPSLTAYGGICSLVSRLPGFTFNFALQGTQNVLPRTPLKVRVARV